MFDGLSHTDGTSTCAPAVHRITQYKGRSAHIPLSENLFLYILFNAEITVDFGRNPWVGHRVTKCDKVVLLGIK